MAHPEQENFVKLTMEKYPSFRTGTVLEVGSLNVNGSIRKFFNSPKYVGVDVAKGPDVDVVTAGHLYESEEQFDVVCSTECFEHDEHYRLTLKKMYDLLRDGGLFFFTCASTGRREHGTKRTGVLWGTSPDYYKNITEEDVREVLDVDKLFDEPEFFYQETSKDLYFRGIKNAKNSR